MVRLKDDFFELPFNIYIISIPYGAIKRDVQVKYNQINEIFQFLMVRLKVILLIYRF